MSGEKEEVTQAIMPGFEAPKTRLPEQPETQLTKPEKVASEIKEPEPRDLVDLIKTTTKYSEGKPVQRHELPNSSLAVEGKKEVAALMVLGEEISGRQAKNLVEEMDDKGISLDQVRAVLKHNQDCRNVREAIDFCSDPKNELDVVHYNNLFNGIQGIDERFHE